MVKLTGPMMSITALGKFGKVMVFSIWKGIQYARMLVTPVNPQSEDQGDRRIMLGGLGRSTKYIGVTDTYAAFAKEVAPAGQSWISWYVDYMMTTFFYSVAGFDALYDEYSALGQLADWVAEATALGLNTFNLDYKGMDHGFVLGFQLYCVGKFATAQYVLDNTKFNAAPYTKTFADWVLADIQLMVADFSA